MMRDVERTGENRDVFHILADTTKRRILDLVREREWSVGELVDYFGLPQPAVSKHLRALREAHMVEVRVDGQRRWYRLRVESLATVDDWIQPYRQLWNTRMVRSNGDGECVPEMSVDKKSRMA